MRVVIVGMKKKIIQKKQLNKIHIQARKISTQKYLRFNGSGFNSLILIFGLTNEILNYYFDQKLNENQLNPDNLLILDCYKVVKKIHPR